MPSLVQLPFGFECYISIVTPRVLHLALVAGLSACANSQRDREWYGEELATRVALEPCGATEHTVPESVSLADGLDETEVVTLCLCRSPVLRAEVTRIDVARAMLADSRRLANPQLSIMAPHSALQRAVRRPEQRRCELRDLRKRLWCGCLRSRNVPSGLQWAARPMRERMHRL